jgi:hypothetical protein
VMEAVYLRRDHCGKNISSMLESKSNTGNIRT